MGFSKKYPYLLIVSFSGRGLFHCHTGEKISRDRNDDLSYIDEFLLEAKGIGPIKEEIIRICGLWGGSLPIMTHDLWKVARITLE